MRPRLLTAMSLLLLATGCATLTLPPARPLARPIAYRVAYEPYPSGLRLVVHEDPKAPRVTMDVSYRVGATDELPGQEGLAHLVEHLTFLARHGSPRAPRLGSRMLASGAQFNAFTTHDSTDYWFTAPVEHFSRLAALEAQRMREPLAHLTEEDFLVERDVVVAELRQRHETSPEGAQYTWVQQELLPGHPYGRPVGGTPESVQRLTLEDVRAFVKRHYTPAHAVVVVSGPLSAADVKYEVARSFMGLTGAGEDARTPPVERTPPPFPEELRLPSGQRMVVKPGPVEYPRLWMMWTVPGLYSGKTAQALAASALLDMALGRRLWRDERVHAMRVFPHVMDGATLLVAAIDLQRREDAEAVATLAVDQLISLVTDNQESSLAKLHTDADVATIHVRSRLLTDAYLELEQLSTPSVATFLRATGEADYIGGWQKQLREGLSASLGGYFYEQLTRERARMLLVVPEKEGAGRLMVSTDFTALPGAEDFGRWDVPLPPGAHDVRRVAQPPGLEQASRFTLPNGLDVVAVRRGSIPVVEVRLLMDTGVVRPGEASRPPLAMLSSWFSAAGAWRHGPKVGARISRRVEEDHALVASSAASGNLPHLLDDLREWLIDWGVEYRVFEHVQEWEAHQVERDSVRPAHRAQRELKARLFPGHGYGAVPTPEEAKSFTPGQADTWLGRHLHPTRMTLFLVGDLPPDEELRPLVEGLLGGGWGRAEGMARPGEEEARPALPEARSVVVVDRPGASQADVRLGLRGPVLEAGQEAVADTLTSLVEERLRHQLRERLGLTYGVHVWHEARQLATTLSLRTAVDAQATAGVLEQVLAELGTLEDTPLPEEVVQRARWQVARGYDLRFRTAASVAGQLVRQERLGRAADHWEQYPTHLARVTPAALQALVRQLSLGREVVVITGDAALLKPQLEAAGFQVEVLSSSAPEAHAP